MALTYSNGIPLGSQAPDFNLPATDGKTYSLKSFTGKKVLGVVFTCNHCPYAQAWEDRLIALQKEYAPKGVQFVLINPNDEVNYPEDSFENMVERAKRKRYPFPYLRDKTQEVARTYKAVCTPDLFVFDGERRLRYNGRVDDNWKEPAKVTSHDLRRALDCLLAGQEIDFDAVPSMGCSIKWVGTRS